MKAFEVFVLELYLNLTENFPREEHPSIYTQVREVYAPIQWRALSPADREQYFFLESITNNAARNNQVVMPVIRNEKIGFVS